MERPHLQNPKQNMVDEKKISDEQNINTRKNMH